MQVKFLQHKLGGQILSIDAIEHKTVDGVADWFYRGDVKWEDEKGAISKAIEIQPWAICFDHSSPEAWSEYEMFSIAMNGHLAYHGRWLKKTKFVNGRAVNWEPKILQARTPT